MAKNLYHHRVWTEEEVGRIVRKLREDARRGIPTYYQVSLDGLKIIGRTNDHEELKRQSAWLKPEKGDSLEIRLFNGNGYTANIFRLSHIVEDEPLEAPPPPPEPDHELRTELLLERQSRGHEREMMQVNLDLRDCRRDLELLRKEHAELSRYTDELEAEVRQQREGKGSVHLGEIGSVVLENIVRRNPDLISGGTLAGPPEPGPQSEDPGELIIEDADEIPPQWSETVAMVLSLEKSEAAGILYVTQYLAVEPKAIAGVISNLNPNPL